MAKSIGIDFGQKCCKVAYSDDVTRILSTGPYNEDLCLSCIAIDSSENFVVGNAPFKNWRRYAPNIVTDLRNFLGVSLFDPQILKMKSDKDRYPFGISKLSGGTDDSLAIILKGKEFTAEQLCAVLLRQLKNDTSTKLGDEVTHAVITVPAYFNEKQKTATRKAAELAGLKVQCLLAEPTAAAISYGADKMTADEDKIFLVYDFGATRFDLSIIVASGGNFIESGSGGDKWLGGKDIDHIISEYVLTEAGKANNVDIHNAIKALSDKKRYVFQGEFKNEVESAKKALGQSESATIYVYDYLETEDGDPIDIEVTLTRANFENMIRPLIQRTLDLIDELLEKTAYPIDTIDNILLVGGSSCIPLVRQMLTAKYGKDKILSSEKPMFAIAEGAAILSHSMGTESECPNCGMIIPVGSDECPYCHMFVSSAVPSEVNEDAVQISFTTKHKYFIEVADDADNKKYELIIGDNEVLPNDITRKSYISTPGLYILKQKVYCDADNNSKEIIANVYIISNKPFPNNSKLDITYHLSKDEELSVKALTSYGDRITLTILGRGSIDDCCLGNFLELNKLVSRNKTNNDNRSVLKEIHNFVNCLIKKNGILTQSEWVSWEHNIQILRNNT